MGEIKKEVQHSPGGCFEIHHEAHTTKVPYQESQVNEWRVVRVGLTGELEELASFSGETTEVSGNQSEGPPGVSGVQSVYFEGDQVIATYYDGKIERIFLPNS